MNWFERHLNWTAGIIMLVTPLVYMLLMYTTSGWYDLGDYLERDRGTWLTVFFIIISFGLVFLNMAGFIWILRKKNRNPWKLLLLLFFVPILVTFCYGFIAERRWNDSPSPLLWSILGVLICYIGWSFLIKVKTKTAYGIPAVNTIVSGQYKRFVIIPIIAILVLSSLSSLVYMRTGTTTYEYPHSESTGIPRLTFEYPVSFIIFDDTMIHFPFGTVFNNSIFGSRHNGTFSGSMIQFAITPLNLDIDMPDLLEYLAAMSPTPKSIIFVHGVQIRLPLSSSFFKDESFKLSPTADIDKQIYQTSTNISFFGQEKLIPSSYFVTMVKDQGFTLVIELLKEETISDIPPEWFIQLVETFSINEN